LSSLSLGCCQTNINYMQRSLLKVSRSFVCLIAGMCFNFVHSNWFYVTLVVKDEVCCVYSSRAQCLVDLLYVFWQMNVLTKWLTTRLVKPNFRLVRFIKQSFFITMSTIFYITTLSCLSSNELVNLKGRVFKCSWFCRFFIGVAFLAADRHISRLSDVD
jgi:hypothetical protein